MTVPAIVTIEMLVAPNADVAGRRLTIDDLPVPQDVQIGAGWTPLMIEMADHIGPYHTMLIVDRFGGRQCYISMDPDQNLFRDLVGPATARTISRIYGREQLDIPVAQYALHRAKRAVILAAVRQRAITASQAARIMRCARASVSRLLNRGDEGRGVVLPRALRKIDPRQLVMFDED